MKELTDLMDEEIRFLKFCDFFDGSFHISAFATFYRILLIIRFSVLTGFQPLMLGQR